MAQERRACRVIWVDRCPHGSPFLYPSVLPITVAVTFASSLADFEVIAGRAETEPIFIHIRAVRSHERTAADQGPPAAVAVRAGGGVPRAKRVVG
ncbi:hypothetical protein FIBSPDRAFT_852905 [Athelia psychrophila]|uniref:Uncharacterized protein n=1 Tax=Athelia psychrophila TaxID=1759441 RepID=A0A166RA59_9AGAM|nr:hypothetical protein FIBSPDRAFT_852905 [Fibularhizoctonia sp. CBS 109695]